MSKIYSKNYLKVIFVALFVMIISLAAYCVDDRAYYGCCDTGEASFILFKLEMSNDKVNFFTLPFTSVKKLENNTELEEVYIKENLSRNDFMVIRQAFNTEKTIRLIVDKISRSKSKILLITKPQNIMFSHIDKVTLTGTINGSKIAGHIKIDHIDEKDSWPAEYDMELQQIK
ncbi:MAG TPA: hypothetical protein DDW50_01115 [Firmicutes bacterium]|jgi:hypothetical protein|nr:hypothetical protein [Bacillota bacterium]